MNSNSLVQNCFTFHIWINIAYGRANQFGNFAASATSPIVIFSNDHSIETFRSYSRGLLDDRIVSITRQTKNRRCGKSPGPNHLCNCFDGFWIMTVVQKEKTISSAEELSSSAVELKFLKAIF